MNKKRLWLTILSILSLVLFLAACGSSNNSSSTTNNTTNGEVNTTEEKYTFKLSHGYTAASLHNKHMEWFNEELNKRSNGQLSLEIYPSGQLMPIDQEIPGILQGTIDMTHHLNPLTGNFEPTWFVFDVPFLFNYDPENPTEYLEHSLAFVRSENGGGKIKAKMEEKGLKVLAMTATEMPMNASIGIDKIIKTPEDMKGLKIRLAGGIVTPETIKALGASGVAVAGPEIPTAIQQGLVDGALLAPIYINDNKLPFKTQTSVPLANYVAPVIMSLEKFNSLPKELQQILVETGQELDEYSREVVKQRTLESYENFEKENIEVYRPTEEELKQWREAVQPAWDTFIKKVPEGQELIDEAQRLSTE